ncbi:MAG: DUF642 domain-containing protein [Opitutaceae bacterium]
MKTKNMKISMPLKSAALGILASALALALSPAAHANLLLTNGSFETDGPGAGDGDGVNATSSTQIPGWTVDSVGGNYVYWINTINPYDGTTAEDGSEFLDLTGYNNTGFPYDGVSQTINTTVGDQYAVSFYLGQNSDYDNGALPGIVFSATGNSDSYAFDTDTGVDTWQQFNETFIATGTSTTLTFTAFAFDSGSPSYNSTSEPTVYYAGLDNVSALDDGPVSHGVPDGADTAGLLALTLGALLLARRREGRTAAC